MKTCTKCNLPKATTEFFKNPRGKDGFASRCKLCNNAATAACGKKRYEESSSFRAEVATSVKKWKGDNPDKVSDQVLRTRCKRAGTTVEVYKSLPKKCSFPHCQATKPGGKGDWKLDHDHKPGGKFRGLLCDNHNKGLGHFHDNIEELQDAIDYLKKSKKADEI